MCFEGYHAQVSEVPHRACDAKWQCITQHLEKNKISFSSGMHPALLVHKTRTYVQYVCHMP